MANDEGEPCQPVVLSVEDRIFDVGVGLSTEVPMMEWVAPLLEQLGRTALQAVPSTSARSQHRNPASHLPGVHLAILVQPYLDYILDGRKTVESRFSANRMAPYKCVHDGDLILLKAASGPVVGLCWAKSAKFFDLRAHPIDLIRQEYAHALCAEDDAFWDSRKSASYATLIEIHGVMPLPSWKVDKRDRRGWVVLHDPQQMTILAGSSRS